MLAVCDHHDTFVGLKKITNQISGSKLGVMMLNCLLLYDSWLRVLP